MFGGVGRVGGVRTRGSNFILYIQHIMWSKLVRVLLPKPIESFLEVKLGARRVWAGAQVSNLHFEDTNGSRIWLGATSARS